MEETIVALATPAGNSGVAVIRVSGAGAKKILQQLIKQNLQFEPRKMYLKNVYAGNFCDKCLVVFFASPFSFTGEDVAEIHAHGGFVLAQKIINQILAFGARLATAGEFSKRAFLNGKMSLDQAEGIMDLINAETDAQLQAGSNLFLGRLKATISAQQEILTNTLAEIEAQLDYPEYDFSAQATAATLKKLTEVKNQLQALLNTSTSGQLIKNGVKVAIVGAPNVGKSSLLNALTKTQKAIVTNIAGTTRDVVEAEYEFNGIIFRLFDTAGIHESTDEVEKIGIERAKKMLEECDIVLRLSEPNSPCQIKTTKPHIDVLNKMDLCSVLDKPEKHCGKLNDKKERLYKGIAQAEESQSLLCHCEGNEVSRGKPNNKKACPNIKAMQNNVIAKDFDGQNSVANSNVNKIEISALTGANIEELKQLIFNQTIHNKIDAGKLYLTNARHIECVKTALQQLEEAIANFSATSMDVISHQIKAAWLALGEISGTTSNEAILDKIFSTFCLGK